MKRMFAFIASGFILAIVLYAFNAMSGLPADNNFRIDETSAAKAGNGVKSLCGQPSKVLDGIYPERMERINSILSTATVGSYIVFDSDGTIADVYESEEAFVFSLWEVTRKTDAELGELESSMEASIYTGNRIHEHEFIDNRDLDHDGKYTHLGGNP